MSQIARWPILALLMLAAVLPAPCVPAESSAVEQAATLLDDGKFVAARQLLMDARRAGVPEADRDRFADLLTEATRRTSGASRGEVALQRATLALEQGDLRLAEKHATTVRRLREATPEQLIAASDLLDRAAVMRDELRGTIAPALAQVVTDYDRGNYPAVKAGLDSVQRTGVRLTSAQEATVDEYTARIVTLEKEHGAAFQSEYVPLGVLRAAGAGQPIASAVAQAGAAQNGGSEPAEQAPAPEPQSDPFNDARRLEAERLFNEANIAFERGEFAEAIRLYTEVTTIYRRDLPIDQLTLADQRLREAEIAIGAAVEDSTIEVLNERQVLKQQAELETQNLIDQAEAALEAQDTDTALDLNRRASLRWRRALSLDLLAEGEYEATQELIDAQRTRIDEAAILIAEQVQESIAESIAVEQEREAAQREAELIRQIDEYYVQIRSLQQELRYEEALRATEELLFIDPNNPAALLARDVLQEQVILRTQREVARERRISHDLEFSIEFPQRYVLTQSLIEYPETWPQITLERFGRQSFTESEVDRRTIAQLENPDRPIPATFQGNPLEDVIAAVRQLTGLDIDVDWDALESQLGVTRDTPIDLDLGEKPVSVVLERVLARATGVFDTDGFQDIASYAVQDGVVVIGPESLLKRRTFLVVYDVDDLIYDPPDFVDAPEVDVETQGGGGGAGGGGGGNIFGGGGGGGGDDDDEEFFERDIEDTEELVDIIVANVGTDDDWAAPLGSGLPGRSGNITIFNITTLLIRTTSRNHREVQRLLDLLREVRSVQISVEARFLQVNSNFLEAIGFDLDIFLNTDNNQVDSAIQQVTDFAGVGDFTGGETDFLPSNITDALGVTTGGPGALPVTGSVAGYVPDPDNPGQFLFDDTITYSVVAPDGFSVIPVEQGSAGNALGRLSGLSGFANTLFNDVNFSPALAVGGTFLDDIQVDFLLEATQQDERTIVLQAPRLTFVNGRSAWIATVTEETFVSGLTPVTGASAGAFQPQVGTVNTGFSLLLRGVASADRRYVNLTVAFGVAAPPTFESSGVFSGAAGGGGTVGGDASVFTGEFQLPTQTRTQIRTAVIVPDGGTVLMGGQRVASEVEVESGVPVLSKIPVLNRLFSNRASASEETTIILLIKPTVLITTEQEEKNFPGLMDQFEASLLE
ncbi:MAG: hypothetical protein AAGI30_06305 [Planctomycetota bacterium]